MRERSKPCLRMMVERRHQRFGKEPTVIQPEGGSKASGCISVWGGSEGRTAGPLMLVTPSLETPGVHAQWRQKAGVASGAGET